MFKNKLQKMKKYLEKNLKKEFINFSSILYALLYNDCSINNTRYEQR